MSSSLTVEKVTSLPVGRQQETLPQDWSATGVARFLATLARHGGYLYREQPSERALAYAFLNPRTGKRYNQQTVNYWRRARGETRLFREFLAQYAERHELDRLALQERWELVPAGTSESHSAKTVALPAPTRLARALSIVRRAYEVSGPDGREWQSIETLLLALEPSLLRARKKRAGGGGRASPP